jgi:hypothetical protein
MILGPARATGDLQPDILSPMDMDEMLSQLQVKLIRIAGTLRMVRAGLSVH